MKLTKADIKLPERVEEATCQLGVYEDGQDPQANPFAILAWTIQVSNEDLMKVRNGSDKHYVAMPNVFTIFHGDKVDVLAIWPKPDRDYHAVFEYCPARKRI
jgi:hypothetical protein